MHNNPGICCSTHVHFESRSLNWQTSSGKVRITSAAFFSAVICANATSGHENRTAKAIPTVIRLKYRMGCPRMMQIAIAAQEGETDKVLLEGEASKNL